MQPYLIFRHQRDKNKMQDSKTDYNLTDCSDFAQHFKLGKQKKPNQRKMWMTLYTTKRQRTSSIPSKMRLLSIMPAIQSQQTFKLYIPSERKIPTNPCSKRSSKKQIIKELTSVESPHSPQLTPLNPQPYHSRRMSCECGQCGRVSHFQKYSYHILGPKVKILQAIQTFKQAATTVKYISKMKSPQNALNNQYNNQGKDRWISPYYPCNQGSPKHLRANGSPEPKSQHFNYLQQFFQHQRVNLQKDKQKFETSIEQHSKNSRFSYYLSHADTSVSPSTSQLPKLTLKYLDKLNYYKVSQKKPAIASSIKQSRGQKVSRLGQI